MSNFGKAVKIIRIEKDSKAKDFAEFVGYASAHYVSDIDEHEWGYSISKGKVILNKEFKYRDDADEMIKSIQDSEYIFITDWLMRGSYRRMKCTNYGVNYALDANEVLLTLVYAD